MYFSSQQEYERYYLPEQRRVRAEQARGATEQMVSDALVLFNAGDEDAACQRLFDAGIQDDGISCYIQMWRG